MQFRIEARHTTPRVDHTKKQRACWEQSLLRIEVSREEKLSLDVCSRFPDVGRCKSLYFLCVHCAFALYFSYRQLPSPEDHVANSHTERSCNFQDRNDGVRDGSAQQRQSDIHDLGSHRGLDCGQSDLQRKLKYQWEFGVRNADSAAVDVCSRKRLICGALIPAS